MNQQESKEHYEKVFVRGEKTKTKGLGLLDSLIVSLVFAAIVCTFAITIAIHEKVKAIKDRPCYTTQERK